jgi:predicted O-linked N-acetylglucosamine transferase (SPINDLY family)
VMLVVVEWFSAGHSVYRVLSKAIRKMQDQFHLVGMGAMNTTDDAGRGVFNEFIELDMSTGIESFLRQVHRVAQDREAQVLYMPSVGMFQTTMYLANLRVAPLQITTLGHSASTFAPQMDYFVIDEDFVGDDACFSEKVLKMPTDAFPFIPSIGAPETLKQAPMRDKPEKIQIAMAATTMKLNPEFLQTCRTIADQSPTPVHFQFFIGQAQGLMWPQVAKVVQRFMGDFATVNRHQGYGDYLNKLAECDLYINPFPFGNMNGIVDMLSVGLVGVCKSGREPHEHIDEGLFKRLGMPDWLVTRTNEEYIQAALRLINNHEERLSIRNQSGGHLAVQKLFTGREELFGLAVDQLYTELLQNSTNKAN